LMQDGGAKESEKPVVARHGISVYADAANAKAMAGAETLEDCLAAHFQRVGAGDYIALLGFIERNVAHTKAFDAMRAALRDKTGAAVCLGFGPRFLHSTGQAYKGGPASGVFLQVTDKHAQDVAVPGRGYSFGAVIDAQAAGDLAVLTDRGRRAIRVHLDNVDEGLVALSHAVEAALK